MNTSGPVVPEYFDDWNPIMFVGNQPQFKKGESTNAFGVFFNPLAPAVCWTVRGLIVAGMHFS